MKRAFVFCVCGNDQVSRVNRSLRFLKRFTKLDIVVAKARSFLPIYHDQVISCRVPDEFTNQAATTSLKTALHRMMPTDSAEWCYLDSNIFAVDSDVDRIFDRRKGPVGFARDRADIDSQSSMTVECGCKSRRCRHLRQAIREEFSVPIKSGDWMPWKTAVFVFGRDSLEVLDLWHQNAVKVLSLPRWSGRDQWPLAAAIWKLGLQDKPTLPRRFYRVVDGYRGIPRDQREGIPPSRLFVDTSYSLSARGNGKPAFLHFVNGTAGIAGWKNWDDVNNLIENNNGSSQAPPPSAPVVIPGRRGSLTPVHGMWIGASLSRMELLTLRSFVSQGHRFHLWVYDKINTPIPDGVVLEDATEILPRSAVFKRREVDPTSGVGAGSYGAPFSDLFRYKLLHDKGGYWADMDVTCLKAFPSDSPYLFRSHRIGVVGNIMKCPRGSRLMGLTFEQTLESANEDSAWLLPNRILSENVKRLGLSKYIRTNFCNADSWPDVVQPFIENDYPPPADWFAIHWLNEVWRTLSQDGGRFKGRPMLKYKVDKDHPKQGTTLARLYEIHGLNSGWQSNGDNGSNGAGRVYGRLASRNHINVLVPTLAVGGAERIVVDTLAGLGNAWTSPTCVESLSETLATLFVMDRAEPAYSSEIANVEVVQLAPRMAGGGCDLVASRVLRSGTPTLFVHLGDAPLLARLWNLGVRTIPVVHNTAPGWTAPADIYNHPNVPFVVAVCEKVAQQLREYGCLKRIVVIRHELAPNSSNAENAEARKTNRSRYGIRDDTLLVGMVGQFKRQKNYPKAIQVLAELQKSTPAKLMILGPWDHPWGDSRRAFAETCRTACDLDVVADLISVGAVMNVEEYYPAFDVLLSTSDYEGLSISMLEANRTGCPIVSSDVGGAAEIDSSRITLLPSGAAPEEYAEAIISASTASPVSSATPDEPGLIPEIWNLLGQFGDSHTYRTDSGKSACIARRLDSGSQYSKTAQRLAAEGTLKYVLCTEAVDSNCERILRSHNVQIYDMSQVRSPSGAAGAIMRAIQETGVSRLYVVGLDCRLRLLLAKVLPPDAITIHDADSIDTLFQKMAAVRDFQRRIAFDESEYFRRVSPWPNTAASARSQ